MIKIFIDNLEAFEYECKSNATIKQVLKNICKQRQLNYENYEAFDWVTKEKLNDKKRIKSKELHLRGNRRSFLSDSNELSISDQTIRSFSAIVLNDNTAKEKKTKKRWQFKWRIHRKKSNDDQSEIKSVENIADDKIKKISNIEKRKYKRQKKPSVSSAQFIEMKNGIPNSESVEKIDIQIPQPPSDSTGFVEGVQPLPYQVDSQIGIYDDNESTYAEILDGITPVPKPANVKIPKPIIPDTPVFTNERSESPEHVYSVILKKNKKIKPNPDDNINQEVEYKQFSNIPETTKIIHGSINKKNLKKNSCDSNISDNSSISDNNSPSVHEEHSSVVKPVEKFPKNAFIKIEKRGGSTYYTITNFI